MWSDCFHFHCAVVVEGNQKFEWIHMVFQGDVEGRHCLLRCFPSSISSSVHTTDEQEAPFHSLNLALVLLFRSFFYVCWLFLSHSSSVSVSVSVYLWTTAYTIDTVRLTIEPRNAVQTGTAVRLRCQVSVSHSNIPNLIHSFQLTRDDVPIYTNNATEDTVEYKINPARAADSGNYECRVSVKNKAKASNSQKLDVKGTVTFTSKGLEIILNVTFTFGNCFYKATKCNQRSAKHKQSLSSFLCTKCINQGESEQKERLNYQFFSANKRKVCNRGWSQNFLCAKNKYPAAAEPIRLSQHNQAFKVYWRQNWKEGRKLQQEEAAAVKANS